MQNNAQNTFQVEKWSDAHTDGLMRVSDQVHLIRMQDVERSRLQPYTPPVDNAPEPVVTLSMKRYFAAGSFTTVCFVVIAAAEQGAFAAAASIGGYIVAIGGGLVVVVAALRSCLVWTPSGAGDSGNGQSKTGGNNYYQYNNFGEQPNQNNGTK